MAGKIRWIYEFFRENYITGKIWQVKFGGFYQIRHIYTRHYFLPATILPVIIKQTKVNNFYISPDTFNKQIYRYHTCK